MLKRPLLILALLFPVLGHAHDSVLPPDCAVTGEVDRSGGALTNIGEKKNAILEGRIDAKTPVLVLKGKAGMGKPGLVIDLKDGKGGKASLIVRAMDRNIKEINYPDSYLSLGWKGGWGSYYVRPNPSFYKPEERVKRQADWEKLPGASGHSFALEFKPNAQGQTEVWLDGQFIQLLEVPLAESYRVSMAPGATIESLRLETKPPSSPLLLPVAEHARVNGMTDTRLVVDANASMPLAFKELDGANTEGIAVGGLGTFPGLATDDLQSFFWRRHASENLPEQRMFSVPLATYSHAYVLCAMEENSEKVNAFTLRVTRYGSSRGNAMADTVVQVPAPDSKGNANARRVGVVSYGPENGRKEAPLWLIKVPVRNGLIQDILYDDTSKSGNVGTYRYLDIDLLDPLKNAEEANVFPPRMDAVRRAWMPTPANYTGYDYYTFWPAPQTSGVNVFGIELEKSPAAMTVRANTGFQAFYASDKPEFEAKVKADEAGDYTAQWEIADVAGKVVATGNRQVKLDAGAEGQVSIPVEQGAGWYAARVRLSNAAKVELIDYRTSFAMLPPDTRKAGLESPFYGFWFGKNHHSDVKLDEVGPLLQRLGIRRVGLPEEMPESLTLKKYGFTESTVGFAYVGGGRALRDFRDGKMTLEEAVAVHEAHIRSNLELWPSIDRMLVFHESGATGAPFPTEMWGEPAQNLTGTQDENSPEALLRKEGDGAAQTAEAKAHEVWKKNWPKRIEYLTAMSKMVREKFPQLKMQYGNDGNSLGIMGELFRQKFPRKWIDTISIEDLGQTFSPERALIGGFQSAWFLRETARKMGYGDIPLTACTEWIGRMTERLGLETQAEWKVRDGLLALAYGFDTISIAGINDAGDGYYFSIWANGGLTFRYPTMAPKPAYMAVATLTRVLDQAKFRRFVPTGSTVLYAEEFQHGKDWIYAIWTPRGDREVTLEFPEKGDVALTDLYGRERSASGKSVQLKAGTAPQYVISRSKLVSAMAGVSSFPKEEAPENPGTVIPIESLGDIRIVSNKSDEEGSKKQPETLPHRREGQFEIREVNDPEMGRCVEVELKPRGELWSMDNEYVYLKLPAPIPTDAKNAGVWIKGNGSWGQVDVWKTRPWGPWATNGNLQMRWPGVATLNFDGWNFIRYPYYDWARATDNSVLGLVISMPRQTLYGTEMAPVQNLKVRIKSIVLF